MYKVSAHESNHIVGAGVFFGLLDLIGVAVMKRVIFGNDGCNFHGSSFFACFLSSMYHTFRLPAMNCIEFSTCYKRGIEL